MDKNTKNKEYYGWAVACLIGLVFIFFMAYSTGNNQQASTPTTSTNTPQYSSSSSYAYPSVPAQAPTRPKGSCKDVTSYDYNWNNDMLCTRPDGTTFYTNYQGARDYLSTQ